jgi:SAM-dependent MidA family methyltransferase
MPSRVEGSTLPALSAPEQHQSHAVLAAVQGALARGGGWLSFEDYLRIVLYAPGLGYYSAGATKFGAGGDFITAPELSELFGRCVARQCAEVLRDGADVLEFGAGTGRLAHGLLSALAEAGTLPRRYFILELSADLRQRQQATLAQLPPSLRARVEWLEALPREPVNGVMLANEVADALPFERFVVTPEGWCARGVSLDSRGRLVAADRTPSSALQAEFERVAQDLPEPLGEGYESELCPLLGPWVAALAAALGSGVALLFDYGLGRREYYHPQRSAGTLRCHFRQRAHEDPFLHPGLQDISAWVDFTRVAEAATDAGLTLNGYCTQAAFLLALDIEAQLAAVEGLERARLASQARQLLLPGEMGESVKVMALSREPGLKLRGFAQQDLRRLL